ncbi:serine threonine kinase [Fusarium longipes]|uniref:Serine threonine kinase n=1 Tax=Fusarium longipes TaxID=694270 RepID=A0A395TAP9_9HYPO|nr:serine threonine kinase [Fusarium longipes]
MPPFTNSELPIITISQVDPELESLPETYSLGDLLRDYQVEGEDGTFWTDKLLRHILTRERIKAELQRPVQAFNDIQIEAYIDRILALGNDSSHLTFLKIFALLALIDHPGDIGNFIEEGLGDQLLPIGIRKKQVYLLSDPSRKLKCFDKWSGFAKDHFETCQWRVDTPYFDSPKGQASEPIHLHPSTRKPLRRSANGTSETPILPDNAGAYGVVIRVDIHPTSHSFEQLLTGINLDCTKFAIKTLHATNTEQLFQKEWEMLKRFSGLAHPHLVTVLGAFKHKEKYSFIFPNAEHDLSHHLETREPQKNQSRATWLSDQLSGLIGALDTIHDPKHLNRGADKGYGRHGDIKCDNILCFKSSGIEKETVLVISDFGLSALNSDRSRSNIPNRKVPPVPGYRPPECDISGGTISRAFDIWTLGCLFLELITWFLGGPRDIKQFDDERTTMFISGSNNNIFFSFKRKPNQGAYVVEWIFKLHQHPNCSDFLHDALDIIEQEMLVVLAEGRTRSPSGKLRKSFERLAKRCASEQSYIRGNPWTHSRVETARALRRENNIAVEAIPNDNAQKLMDTVQIALEVHQGPTRRSLRPKELSNLD